MHYFKSHILLFLLAFAIFNPQGAHSAVDREQEIRESVTSYINSRNAGMGWDVSIRRFSINHAEKLPDGKVEYEVVAPKQWGGWGNVSLGVIVRQNGRVLRNIPVKVDVEAMTAMVVALHQIAHGEIISETDVVLKKQEITYNSELSARTINDVVGKKARVTIKSSQPVRTDQIERVPLIKPGQMVSIIAENDVLKISVAGKARSAGAEGDTIRVQNLNSLKEISARVISATTVQVAF